MHCLTQLEFDEIATSGYTSGMKTAISVPDEIFDEAERLAKRLRVSRSQLYSRALAELLARHNPDAITHALDQMCAELQPDDHDFQRRAAGRVLENTEW